MQGEFPKTYNPGMVEKKWYNNWLENKLFDADNKTSKNAYSILMPPPNVTGILHFGHVLNITLQDLYLRWKKMQGFEVCWFPGTDHAGIATQTRVEKELRKEGLTRHNLGREKFIEKVWEWRQKYGGIILKQLKELGIACDWDKTLFTMDESASNAVKQVFIRLFDEGLIYKGKRIINWSPLSQTALSDEEVEFREVKEHLYTLKYFFKDRSEYLKVATVRPETIFGDVAVAVNPRDKRFSDMIGKTVVVPLVNREVPVIADDYADPEFGTGCVKITPAHDPNDFEVGMRHNLRQLNSINPDGTLNELTGEFNGTERFKARKLILQKLKELDLIEKIEDYSHNIGFSQRGGEPVEPFLSSQWFVKMKPLAELALAPVIDGRIRFFPDHWVKTYQHWLTNIRDWCISRQLWWGHRIPVYYSPDGRYTAASDMSEACRKLNLPEGSELRQDEDVLDTWFSSWLWPLTTMRWLHDGKSESTGDLEKFLPTDLLVTAPDIIFFWVARMIMVSMKFKNQIPFRDVYFTSTIRDGLGRKLSKSLGNSPDPLNIIEKYGADAVRFTIIYLSPLGQDVKMDVDTEAQDIPSVEIGRNFANKIWNAGRFLLMKLDAASGSIDNDSSVIKGLKVDEFSFADKWIYSRFHSTVRNVAASLDNYKVNDYSKLLYDFVWRDFCDWYLEILKVQLQDNKDKSYDSALLKFAVELYKNILKLLHPIMPFITEEIWHLINDEENCKSISLQSSPVFREEYILAELEEDFEFFQMVIEEIRRLRASSQIPPSKKLPLIINTENEELFDFFETEKRIIEVLGKCSEVTILSCSEKPGNALSSVIRDIEIHILSEEAINFDDEKLRLNKEIERLIKNIESSRKKLENENFVSKAPESVVLYEREKLQSMVESLNKVKEHIEHINN